MPDDNTVQFKLGEMSGKLDSLIALHSSVRTDLEDLSGRVDRMERKHSWLAGVGATLVAIMTVFGDVIRTKLGL